MTYIELDRLCLLHQSMNVSGIDRCRFPFHRNHKRFDVFFFADMEPPYELMFGLVRGQWSFSVKVAEGYRVKTQLGDDYYGLCKALDLKFDPNNRFRPVDFFKDLNRVVPSEISRDNEVEPQDVARYCRDVEEADKNYFVGWRLHRDPEVRDVTERNLEKTRRLLGEDAYLHCREHRISTAWTDDPKKATGSWKHFPRSAADGKDTRDVEVERAFKRAIATGLSDLREGREVSLGDAKIRLGLS